MLLAEQPVIGALRMSTTEQDEQRDKLQTLLQDADLRRRQQAGPEAGTYLRYPFRTRLALCRCRASDYHRCSVAEAAAVACVIAVVWCAAAARTRTATRLQ